MKPKKKYYSLRKVFPKAEPPKESYPIPETEDLYHLARQPDGEWGVWSAPRTIATKDGHLRRVGGYFLSKCMKGRGDNKMPGVHFTIGYKSFNRLIHILVRNLVPPSKR